MKRKFQVFISSTYIDLKDERQAAVEAVLIAGHIPAGMELFCAGNESQWNVIKRWIDDSDIYLLILGGRYGTIKPRSKKSYIQLEYEYAKKKGKLVFSIVIMPDLLKKKTKKIGEFVVEKDYQLEYNNFKKTVTSSKLVDFFNDCKDIKISVLSSIKDFEERYKNRIHGWVPFSMLQKIINIHKKVISINTVEGSIAEHTDALNHVASEVQYMEYYARGVNYLSIDKIDKAIEDFYSAISHNTSGLGLSEIYYNLAIAYVRIGDYENAFNNYDKYVKFENEKRNGLGRGL